MARKFLRRLVVDACVLHSAGGHEQPMSRACGRALNEITAVGHFVVVTPAIKEEWMEHAALYSLRWLSLAQSRQRIHSIEDVPEPQLRARIEDSGLQASRIAAALKDVHLLEAARQTDHAIISRDGAARNIFLQIPRVMDGLAWVHPVDHEDETCQWLRAGARAKAWQH